MNKNMLKTILVLTGVLVVLVCLVLVMVPALRNKQAEEPTQPPVSTTAAPEKLGDHEEQDVLAITLQRGGDSYTFIREAALEPWKLQEIPKMEVNQAMVSSLVTNAATGAVMKDIKNDLNDLEGFGLKPAQAVVTLRYSDGTEGVYHVGNLTVDGVGCYAYREGVDRLVVMSPYFFHNATAPAYDFSVTKDFVVSGQDAVLLRIEKDGKPFLEARKLGVDTMSVDDYMITQPYQVLATSDFADYAAYFDVLTLSGMADVSNGDLAKYGLEDPTYTITVQYAEGKPAGTGDFTLYVGSVTENGEDYYAYFEGEEGIYTVSDTAMQFIFKTNPFGLINRNFMLYSISYVDTVTVTQGSRADEVTMVHPTEDAEEGARVGYQLNGKTADRATGGTWYQDLLLITRHGALPEDYTVSGEPTLSVLFRYLPGSPAEQNFFEFFPYEKDYYAVRMDGVAQFYCRKDKVDAMLASLDVLAASAK